MPVDIVIRDSNYSVPDRIIANDGSSYAVEDRLGAGGNGVVHQCTREGDGEIFAVKFLTNLDDSRRRARFERERGIMFALSADPHDHLIRVISDGSVDARQRLRRREIEKVMPFVVMEKADLSLRELIKSELHPVSSAIYMAQFRGLVSALELLHRHAIHRDIKPDNILVVGERWVISDFGLCASIAEEGDGSDLTRHWEVVGPRFWMSPEANNRSIGLDEEISFASDVFQLAAVFWWVVNRRHPSGILCRDDWSGLENLYEPVAKALQHSTSRRFDSAAAFKTAVVEAIES
jgi:serine/threonine protein kinase